MQKSFFGVNYLLDESKKVLNTYDRINAYASTGIDEKGHYIASEYNKDDVNSKLGEINEAIAKIDNIIIPTINNIKSNLADIRHVYETQLEKLKDKSNGGKKTKKHKKSKKAKKSKKRLYSLL